MSKRVFYTCAYLGKWGITTLANSNVFVKMTIIFIALLKHKEKTNHIIQSCKGAAIFVWTNLSLFDFLPQFFEICFPILVKGSSTSRWSRTEIKNVIIRSPKKSLICKRANCKLQVFFNKYNLISLSERYHSLSVVSAMTIKHIVPLGEPSIN